MNQILLISHVVVGLCIIGLVMMQQGKGADAGAAFGGGGGGGSGSLFGASGAGTFLSRATAIFAVVFFSTSLGLAFLSGHPEEAKDLMDFDPALLEQLNSDLPGIAGVVPQTPDDVPVAFDVETSVETTVNTMADEMPVMGENVDALAEQADAMVEQAAQSAEGEMSNVDQKLDEVIEDLPIFTDEVPAAGN